MYTVNNVYYRWYNDICLDWIIFLYILECGSEVSDKKVKSKPSGC